MKTVNTLKNAEISVDGNVVETVEVKNPCQMWKGLKTWFAKHGDNARILVLTTDGAPYKDFTLKKLKNGRSFMVNAVKETNRGAVTKARKAAAEQAAKIEAKKAKRRAYDKARRAKLKAAKQNG